MWDERQASGSSSDDKPIALTCFDTSLTRRKLFTPQPQSNLVSSASLLIIFPRLDRHLHCCSGMQPQSVLPRTLHSKLRRPWMYQSSYTIMLSFFNLVSTHQLAT